MPDTRRRELVKFRLRSYERRDLERRASEAQMPLSEYIRTVLFPSPLDLVERAQR